MKELLLEHTEMKKVLVFSRTKHGADKITRVLEKAGVKCAAIHGNKSQNRRQEALGNFKSEKIRVLVATDIAARGIDVDDVSHVFNYDLPDVPETFVHRIGRTARAGKDGIAISFCSPDEEQDLRAIEKLTRVKIPEGDKAVYEKLPPPQKETPESEMRNARGRMSRNDAEKRASKSREKRPRDVQPREQQPRDVQPRNAQPRENEKPVEGVQHKHRRRNRPGSRARRRMREAASN